MNKKQSEIAKKRWGDSKLREKWIASMQDRKKPPPRTLEYIEKLRQAMTGKIRTEEHCKNLSKALKGNTNAKGRKWKKESLEKISNSLMGHSVSKDTRKKISINNKGKKNPHTKEWDKKISESVKKNWNKPERQKASLGKNNCNWKGGGNFDYGRNWSEQKRKCRKRDNYTCQLCGRIWDRKERRFDVHHIKEIRSFNTDWKSANILANLITLCISCNARASGNRDYWKRKYKRRLLLNEIL